MVKEWKKSGRPFFRKAATEIVRRKKLFELHNIGGSADGFFDDDATDDVLIFGGDADVGEHLAILEVGFFPHLVENLLVDVASAEEHKPDGGLGLSLHGADIGEVGGVDGGTVAHGDDSALGHAAGHAESHGHGGKKSKNSFFHFKIPNTCRVQLLVNE